MNGKTVYQIKLETLKELKKKQVGRVINSSLVGCVLGSDIDEEIAKLEHLIKNVCNFCDKPCWEEHCVTKRKK